MIKLILFTIFIFNSNASVLELKDKYLALGGNSKAFEHLKCVFKNSIGKSFDTKRIVKNDLLIPRCNELEGNSNSISVNKSNVAVIVDYTKKGSEKRMFILDGYHGIVSSHYVSHGSFQADIFNKKLRPMKNSLDWAKYFSNEEGSKASATGLYITGKSYQGHWKGPKGDKFSMVLHGVEPQVNDMACERTIVMHGNEDIRESGYRKGARQMSNGCFMVDYKLVNKMVRRLQGSANAGGSVFFVYGPREAAMDASAYCQ